MQVSVLNVRFCHVFAGSKIQQLGATLFILFFFCLVAASSRRSSLFYFVLFLQMSITKCDFLVDLETERETEREPNFVKRAKDWEVVLKKPFLDAERWVKPSSVS